MRPVRLAKYVVVFLVAGWVTGRLSAQEWIVFTKQNSGLPDNNILSLALDPAGVLWIGTKFEGMAAFDGVHWFHYKPPFSLARTGASSFLFMPEPMAGDLVSTDRAAETLGPQAHAFYDLVIDSKGVKWIGTKIAGIRRFDGTSWQMYDTHNSPLPDDYTWNLLVDPADRIWIGTKYGGLAILDHGAWIVYDTTNSPLPSNEITSLALDHRGRIWIGTTQGIAIYDGGSWSVLTPANSGLPIGHVEAIAFDASGGAWIGTWGAGLVFFNGTRWTVYDTHNSGLPEDYIWSLTVDANATKWIGTFTQGLAIFDNQSWHVFTPANSPLPHEMVYENVVDGLGNKWMATLLGLAVYREGGVLLPSPQRPQPVATSFSLDEPHPNPFSETTEFRLHLSQPAEISVRILDVRGRLVRRISSGTYLFSGTHTFHWNGQDADGHPVPAGVYICLVNADGNTKAVRVVKVR